MQKIAWNGQWTYCKTDGEESPIPVTLPHDAMFSEQRTPLSAGGANTGWFEGHDYTYEKEFVLPPGSEGKTIIFEFEGVYHNAEIFINDELAASRPNGYIGIFAEGRNLDIGGKNLLRVVARNSDQPNSRWYSGAGIYRPVNLYILPSKHILLNGIRIKTVEYRLPQVEIEVETSCGGMLLADISDGDESIYSESIPTEGKTKFTAVLPHAKLWDCENPQLYTCRIQFGEDCQETSFGIRKLEWGSEGFFLNGNRTILRGCALHHDNGLLGACSYQYAEERKVRLLKESGFNTIRSAHNPCSTDMLDACDRLGMLVVDEYTDMWYIHKTRYDYADHFEEWWQRDLHDIIARDYNHPSVIMYSLGNEVSETAQKRGVQLTRHMTELCHQLDNTRPVTCGVNMFFNYLSSLGIGVYSDKKAEQSASSPSNLKKSVGSEFFNNLAGLLGSSFMKFGATLHGSDAKTRDAFEEMDIAGYNYGINRYEKDAKKYPDRIIFGSETFSFDVFRFRKLAEKHPAIIGDIIWSGMDYLGEVGIGAWEYKKYAPDFRHGAGWLTSGCGQLDITGKPRAENAYVRVVYGLDDIRMAVVPADTAGEKHSPSAWCMTNAIESWAWDGCDGKHTKVEVYARACSVKLFVNGICVGEKKCKDSCRVVFSVRYQKGEVMAVACDGQGREIAKASLKSAGEDTELAVVPEQETLTGEGLCYVRFRYTDREGILKPLAQGEIIVTVKGGVLLGFGNACPYNERGYLTNTSNVYYGEAIAIIKPDGNGAVTVDAISPFGNACARMETI
jgi:beta-galactosidase